MKSTPYSVLEELGTLLWPIHLKPRADELLSSWMIRLAHAHGYKSEAMCRMLFGRDHVLWNRDIDRLAPEAVLLKLSEITGASIERTRETTLQTYAGVFAESINVAGHAPWIVPLHVYHRKRTAPSLMYCPQCLRTEEVQFFRRAWRLALITVCTKHEIDLHDTCPSCASAVMLHRVDIGRHGERPRDRAFTRCWNCGFNLAITEPVKSSDELVAFTKHLEQVVDSGFTNWGGNPNLHSIAYFAGLRILAKFAAGERKERRTIEMMPLNERRRAVVRLAELHDAWPRNFVEAVRNSGTTYSNIVGTRTTLPFWLKEVLEPLKRHQHPERDESEVAEIARILSKHGRVTASAMRRRLGVNVRLPKIPKIHQTCVSPETHETLMATLDQSVSGTFDKKARFAFLQDKVMFNLFRFTDLSAAKICDLKLNGLPETQDEPDDSVWLSAPSNQVEALQVLHRHVRRERRKFLGSKECSFVFVSPFTGRPLRETGMHLRFKQLVLKAYLTAAVPSMKAYKL